MAAVHRFLLVLALLLVSTLVAAAPPVPPPDPAPPTGPGLAELLGGVTRVVETMQGAVTAWYAGSPTINAVGKRIAVVLFGLVATWGLIKTMMMGRGLASLAGDVVLPLLLTGLVFAATDGALGQKIYTSLVNLTKLLPGVPATDPGVLAMSIVRSFGSAGLTVWNADFGSTLSASAFVGGIAKIIAGVALMVCAALGCGTIILAQMSGAFGALLAPVLIPWGIWQPTSFLFTSWLRFMVSSGMQIVVTFGIGSLVSSVATRFVTEMSSPESVVEALGMAGGLVLFAIVCLMFMAKAADVASGLVSGDGTMSTSGWQAAARQAGIPTGVRVAKDIGGAAASKGVEMGKERFAKTSWGKALAEQKAKATSTANPAPKSSTPALQLPKLPPRPGRTDPAS